MAKQLPKSSALKAAGDTFEEIGNTDAIATIPAALLCLLSSDECFVWLGVERLSYTVQFESPSCL
jgi:hypothetical protein